MHSEASFPERSTVWPAFPYAALLPLQPPFIKFFASAPLEELILRGVVRGDGPDGERLRSQSEMSPELLSLTGVGANFPPKQATGVHVIYACHQCFH